MLPQKLAIVTEGPREFLDTKGKGRDRKAGRAFLAHVARVTHTCSSAVWVTPGRLQVEVEPARAAPAFQGRLPLRKSILKAIH